MLKLSLREWIVVAVAVGLAAGWWWDRHTLSARQHQTREELITAEMRSAMLEELCEANGYDVNQDSRGVSFKRRPRITPEGRSEGIAADPVYGSEWQPEATIHERPAKLIDEAEAVEVVKKHIARESGREVVAEFSVRRRQNGFSVGVQFGSAVDENGRVTGFFPGGHASYTVSETGEVVDVIGGA